MEKVISISFDEINDEIISKCIINKTDLGLTTDSFETPYGYEVLIHYIGDSDNIASIEILDLKKVMGVIDNEDCLPDVGLLDYEEKELGLNLKYVTLRELYKDVLKKVL